MLPFRPLGDRSARLQGRFCLGVTLPGLFDAGVHGRHAGAKHLHLPRRFILLRRFARRLRLDFSQLADDLLPACLQPFRQLR